ncbi:transcriptional regulator [Sphingobium lactosutens]|nr:transcriptional regulator [Sphingobium lactosutens]
MPGHLIRRLQQIAVAVFHAETAVYGYDLTPVQYAALRAVQEHPGIDQGTLAGLIAYDRTTIAGVVDRLVKKGLLSREVNQADRRAREVRITEIGCEAIEAMREGVERAQLKMIEALSPTEANELIRLLQKVTTEGNELSRAPQRAP